MRLRKIIILIMLVVTTRVWGLNEARLLNQSTSGRTALFNLGSLDGIREGDYAVIVKQIRSLDQVDLRLVPAAKARNIKLNSDSSIWVLYHIYDQELLNKGEKFLILSESTLLSGRRDPRLGRISVIAPKENVGSVVHSALKNDEERTAKLKDLYAPGEKMHERDEKSDTDADLIDVSVWKKSGDKRYQSALYKGPNVKEFRRELRLATFEKLVTSYLKKVNDPDFNYDRFYEEQMRTEWSNEFRKKSNFDTEYQRFLNQQSKKATEDAKLYRSLLEKGETWSEDFSDEELRRTLNEVSVLQERDRREYVISRPTRYSVSVDYGSTLTDAQDKKDTYRRGSQYSMGAGFEVTPFVRHPSLEYFTLEATVRSNKSALEAQTYNTNVDEFSAAIGANWYPWYAPYVVEAPVFFLGSYIRSGFATLNAPTARDDGKYTVLSLPGFKGGMKYVLRNNFGLRIVASMETLNLDRYGSSKSGTVLPDSTKVVEAKVGFGLAYSF